MSGPLHRLGGRGLCSYLLIGFWYEKGWPADAGQKAFVMNRIGDASFLLGTFLLVGRSVRSTWRRSTPAPCRSSHAPALVVRAAPVRRRVRQVGADPAVHVAAGRDGRPDARLRADPRRDDGHGRRLPGRALEPAVRGQPEAARIIGIVAVYRVRRGPTSRWCSATSRRCWPTRPCRSSGTCSSGLRRGAGRDLPPRHARLLQGAPVPRRGIRDPRHERRAGHAQDGRAAAPHAGDVRDVPGRRGGALRACRCCRASSRRTRSWRTRSPAARAAARSTSRCGASGS